MPRQNSTGLNNTTVNASTTGIKTAWTVENVATPGTAGTEFTIAIAADVKSFQIRVRGRGKLQVAASTGLTNTTYWSVIPGNIHREESLNLSGAITLYCELNKASEVVEVIKWT